MLDNAAISAALAAIAKVAGAERNGRDVERAVISAPGSLVGAELLVAAGESLGLRMRCLTLAVESLASGSSSALLPAAALSTDGRPVVLLSASRHGADVLGPEDYEKAVRISWPALRALLGITDPAAQVRWVLADPETGLDAMRAQATEDGHGHAEGDAQGHGHDAYEHDAHGMSPLRRLLALVKLERDDVWVAVVYAVGVGLLSLATPLGVQFLVNTVAFGALVQPLVVLSTLVLAGLVFAGVLRGLQAYVVERLQQRIFARVALDLSHRLPRVKLDALDGRHGPELVNRFFDVITVQKGAATMLVDGISIFLQTLVGTLLLAFYHPFLLAFDVILLGTIVVVVFILGRGAIPSAIKESKAKYALAAWLQETARHVETFKLQHGEELARSRAEALTRDYVSARKKHYKVVFRQFAGALVIQAAASAALLGVGGWLVIARQLTLGQLVAAELIVTAVVAGFSKLGKYFESFYDLVAAVDKLGHMIDLPIEEGGDVIVPARDTGMEVHATTLAVRHGHGALLSNIHLRLPGGGSLAIVGDSGSGKTAVVDALTGVRPHVGGRIDIDGISIDEVALAPLRREMAIVRLDGLFAGTIDDNLRLGRQDISRHDLRVALESLRIWDEVSSLPRGLDTLIATHGKGLPSELAHLLVIARAVATRPRLLVLDGVLDVLAPQARKAVRDAVLAPNRPWSVVVTTSDSALLPWFDRSYAIENGTLLPATNAAALAHEVP
jgi:ABC-type bacteriocin/lantibiotic exporter with double-glycine peptidase domain